MRLNRRRRTHGLTFDLTPMIDVVFQLIIFFMTCSQISNSEEILVELPNLAGTPEPGERDITINIKADGTIFLKDKPVDVSAVENHVKSASAAKGGPDRVRIVLRVDTRAECAQTNRVIACLARCGIPKGKIAVQPTGLRGR